MANTDRAGTMKRSRGDTTEAESTTKSSKKRKKQKKQTKNNSKENKKAAGGDSSSKEQEITSTPEGLAMTQVLSTLNKLERSRFEAFRRSTLPGNAVSEYIAHLLLLQNEHLVARTKASSRLLGAGSGVGLPHLERAVQKQQQQQTSHSKSSNGQGHAPRPLHDLVSPNNADSIVVVVSSLAKAYAQRLVTAAKRVAVAQGFEEGTPLQPHHLEQAHEARVQAGLDPGFFMQKPGRSGIVCGKVVAAALGRVDRHDLLRQAALEAQEEYDRCQANDPPASSPKPDKEKEEAPATEPEAPSIDPSQEEKATPMEVVRDAMQTAEQKPVPTAVPVDVVKETTRTEEQKPLSAAVPMEVVREATQEELKPLPVDVMDLDELEEPSTDEPSEVEPAAMAELPLPQSAITATTLSVQPEAPLPVNALSVPPPVSVSAPPAPKSTAATPMSMEDALLNDLDSDDSDDD